jgi:Tetratricopeptide repeat
MNNLSCTLKKLRRDDGALSMLQACVQLRNQQLGPSHPHTVDATATLKVWQTPIEILSSKDQLLPADRRSGTDKIHIQSNLCRP